MSSSKTLKSGKFIEAASLLIVMALWGIHLGCPLHKMQNLRFTFFGYLVPIYYLFTALPLTGLAVLAPFLKRAWTKWELAWWILPLVCVPGILWSGDPVWSVRQCLSWVIRGLVPGGILYLFVSPGKSKSWLTYWIFPIILAASALGLFEFYADRNPLYDSSPMPVTQTLQPGNPFYRPVDPEYVRIPSLVPTGTQGNRIPYAATILAFLPFGLWLLKHGKKCYWARLSAIVTLFLILILSQVRAVWVGMLTAIILMRIIGLQRNLKETGLVVAGMLLCLAGLLSWPQAHHFIWERLHSFHLSQGSIRERLEVLWTVQALRKSWFVGVGFGQFPVACKAYRHGTESWFGTPDNQYLRWLIENGVFGLAALFAFFAGLIRAGWDKVRRMKDVGEADFYKSLLVGWASIAVTFLFFDGFYWGACNMTFWSLLGLFATALKSVPENPPPSDA